MEVFKKKTNAKNCHQVETWLRKSLMITAPLLILLHVHVHALSSHCLTGDGCIMLSVKMCIEVVY